MLGVGDLDTLDILCDIEFYWLLREYKYKFSKNKMLFLYMILVEDV